MLSRLSLLLLLCLAGTFALAATPTITTIVPTSAVVGTVITITGTDLDKVTAVTFNGIAAKTITDNTATALKVTVPEGATSGKLVVTAAGGTITNPYDFIVLLGLKTNEKDKAEMVWVPGGTFTMGNFSSVGYTLTRSLDLPAGTKYGDDYEYPLHKVTLTGYWIYQYDVTVAQYSTFCAATKRKLPQFPSGYSWKGKTGWEDPALQQHPIVNVSWNDAKAYADWAGVTLPTEAQWEYAARGSRGNNYPWGGTATKNNQTNGRDETKCANSANSRKAGKSTWPVGSFPAGASWCGAQDMAGNVFQWCGDWYGAYAAAPPEYIQSWDGHWYGPYAAAPVTNPTGPATGNRRVQRGGSWLSDSDYCRSTYRGRGNYYVNSDDYSDSDGFRCASVSPGP